MARASYPKQFARLLEKVWPNHTTEKMGEEHMVYCPFCDGDKPKCAVNTEKAVFQCWVCGERGNTHKFLRHLVSMNIIRQSDMDAVLVGKGGSSLSDEIAEYKKTEAQEPKMLWSTHVPCVFPDGVSPLYTGKPQNVLDEQLRSHIKGYLNNRSLGGKDIRHYKLHYCFKPGSVYHGHVFFPSLGVHGRQVVFWTTRATLKNDGPKSLHAGHKYSRFSAKQILFNEHLVVSTTMALCEGPFDAHSIMKVTGTAPCPLLGKQLHPYHINRMLSKGLCRVYVCLDPDARPAAHKVADALRYEQIEVFDVVLKDGDPNDVSPEELKTAFRESRKAAGNPIGAIVSNLGT